MNTIPQLKQAISAIFGDVANQLGERTGFIKRNRKLCGSSFAKAMVFGFQNNPIQTYSELSQSSAAVGVKISSQGLEQRMTAEAAKFMYQLLEQSIQQVVCTDPIVLPFLERFNGVHLRDSSVVSLPAELKDIWPGVGGSAGANAAVKLQVSLNYASGQLYGPVLQTGRTHDRRSPFHEMDLPAGALRLADLGFFDLDLLERDNQRGVFWLMRLKTGTGIFDSEGTRINLLPWLRSLKESRVEIGIYLGNRHRIPCRLLIERVPQEVSDKRRYRLKEYARKQQVPLSAEILELSQWTMLVTNVPVQMLTIDEAIMMLRVRWQVELLFKQWKSYARIDEWRSKKPWRILCELYAKLIGVVISHWIQVLCLWQYPDRSLFKAVKVIQKYAMVIALSLEENDLLDKVLSTISHCLGVGCSVNKRRFRQNASQLLLSIP
jgi:hypothetical protein